MAAAGKVAGAPHVLRGMFEFGADPASPCHAASFDRNRPVLLYCASGGRSALSGKVLKEKGDTKVFSIGGFKDGRTLAGRWNIRSTRGCEAGITHIDTPH